MIVACHCEGTGWKFWGDSNLKSKFWGRSIQLEPVGVLTLEFDDGEVLQWRKVSTPSRFDYQSLSRNGYIFLNSFFKFQLIIYFHLSGYNIHIQSYFGKTVL